MSFFTFTSRFTSLFTKRTAVRVNIFSPLLTSTWKNTNTPKILTWQLHLRSYNVVESKGKSMGESDDVYVLNDGYKHPKIGFGTYKVGFIPASASGSGGVSKTETEYKVDDLVREACKIGYRFFDCAEYYGNEDKVGVALANCGLKREELYIASKVWTTTVYKGPAAVREQVLKSLKDLRIEYFDLYLIHWPVPGKHVEAYLELEKMREEGLIRSIGVSNYTVEDYKELEAKCSVPPAINQIEVNPFLYRKNTIDFFKSKNCYIQAYRSLCNGKAFENPALVALSQKHGRPVAQILGAFILQQGLIYMAKSTKVARIQENFNVKGIVLDAEDIQTLEGLTTSEACAKYIALYKKCVIRDTPLETQSGDVGVKQTLTAD